MIDVDVSTYERDGYVTTPVLFGAGEVATFLAAGERVVGREYRTGRAPALALPPDPGPRDLVKVDNAWWADPDLASLATDPRLGAVAAALLGVERVRLWQDQLLWKPPGGPATTTIGWHQDWASWDNVASAPDFVTAWVAFDDVDDANGAMQVLPGTHRLGLVPGGSNFFATDRAGQLAAMEHATEPRTVALAAGQVSFHHPLTFHGSGPNTSDRMRRSLAVHFVADGVAATDEPGIWQHYNLALFRERGGDAGRPYEGDDLCPLVPTAASAQ